MSNTLIGCILVVTTTAYAGKDLPSVISAAPIQERVLASSSEQNVPGTIAHWRFVGTPGSIPADGVSISDAGHRFDAVIFGGPMYRLVERRPGLEFNGGNDRVFVKDNPAFALTASLTLEAIIRYDGVAPAAYENQIVFRGDDRGQLDPWCLYITQEGRLLFHIEDAERRRVELLSPHPIPTGRMMSVAGTLDDGSGEMRLYIDGELLGSAVTNIRPMGELDASAKPCIGIGNVQSDKYQEAFNGLICEVRISDRAQRPEDLLRVNAPNVPSQTKDDAQNLRRGKRLVVR